MFWIAKNINFVNQTKINSSGAKTAPRAPKLGYFDRRAPQLSARVNHGTPAAGVIGHVRVCIQKNLKSVRCKISFCLILLKIVPCFDLGLKQGGGANQQIWLIVCRPKTFLVCSNSLGFGQNLLGPVLQHLLIVDMSPAPPVNIIIPIKGDFFYIKKIFQNVLNSKKY